MERTVTSHFPLEVLKISLSKAHDTASGPDNIHYQMLKHLPDPSLNILLELMNKIWLSGNFPSIWKLATVIPIIKTIPILQIIGLYP